MAVLSKSARAKLPASQFAGPGRSFPVNDAKHAKAAILDSKDAPNPATIKARAKVALAKFNKGK